VNWLNLINRICSLFFISLFFLFIKIIALFFIVIHEMFETLYFSDFIFLIIIRHSRLINLIVNIEMDSHQSGVKNVLKDWPEKYRE